jgi:hypothetical protein
MDTASKMKTTKTQYRVSCPNGSVGTFKTLAEAETTAARWSKLTYVSKKPFVAIDRITTTRIYLVEL